MSDRASVCIINEGNEILLIHRKRDDEEYYVLPGGGIEEEETPEEAAIREAKEEVGLDIEVGSKITDYINPVSGRKEHLFLSKKFNGEIKLGGPEIERQSEVNIYNQVWVKIDDLENINLVPQLLSEIIIKFCST